MDLQLKGKSALVTGSTKGIGAACAKSLAAEGVRVAIHGRDANGANEVQAAIKAMGGECFICLGDLRHSEQAGDVAHEAQRLLGGIDILVNNASDYVLGGWGENDFEIWERLLSNNVVSMARVTAIVIPAMRAAGFGRVIQMASTVGTRPVAVMAAYAASKAAILNLTVGLAQELAGSGVTANSISPGPTDTETMKEFMLTMAGKSGQTADYPEVEREALKTYLSSPVGRMAHGEDIGDAVAFLASPRSSFISGANLRVDGGWTAVVN